MLRPVSSAGCASFRQAHNPSIEVLEWLSAARSSEAYDVYLNNRKLKENFTRGLSAFLRKETKSEPTHMYHFREKEALSISVEA